MSVFETDLRMLKGLIDNVRCFIDCVAMPKIVSPPPLFFAGSFQSKRTCRSRGATVFEDCWGVINSSDYEVFNLHLYFHRRPSFKQLSSHLVVRWRFCYPSVIATKFIRWPSTSHYNYFGTRRGKKSFVSDIASIRDGNVGSGKRQVRAWADGKLLFWFIIILLS